MISPPEPAHVRERLVDVLRRDLVLVGADPQEILPVAPSRFYLTGFLVPHEAPADARRDADPDDDVAADDGVAAGDDDGDAQPEGARPARRSSPPR